VISLGKTEQRRSEKKAAIVRAAAVIFAQKGFSGAVMAEIAVQAGIGKGSIYEYFESKEELFFAVFQWVFEKTGSAAQVSVSALGGSASQRLLALSETLMASWYQMKDMFSLVMEFWAASASSQMRERFKEAFRQAYAEFRVIVSTLIQEGIERGEFNERVHPESVAAALVGTWDALLLQAWFEVTFDPLSAGKNFMVVLLKGLAAGANDG
jgi:AcrR family transcriptional regulator